MENLTQANADKVREAVRASGLTTKEVAKALGLDIATFRGRLVGDTDFSFVEMFLLCELVGKNLSDFTPQPAVAA